MEDKSFVVVFNLKNDRRGSAVPAIYGNCADLGKGNPEEAISLTPVEWSPYNYTTHIRFEAPVEPDTIWYSYCFHPPFGAIIPETIPRRFLPALSENAIIYDNINTATAVADILIHFRVRCNTEYGQELYIVGNIKELGCWDTSKAIQMCYEGFDDYWACDVRLPLSNKERSVQYKYFKSNYSNAVEWEPEEDHSFNLTPIRSPAILEVVDQYRWSDQLMNAFTRTVFKDVLFKRENPDKIPLPKIDTASIQPCEVYVLFTCLCPHIRKNQRLCICGNIPQLGDWNPENSIIMSDSGYPMWHAELVLPRSAFPFEYKFVIIEDVDPNTYQKPEIKAQNEEDEAEEIPKIKCYWEKAANRFVQGITIGVVDDCYPGYLYLNNWFVCPEKEYFKGLGLYVPLFSLRTSESCGIGQYPDLIKLVDICNKVGASLIQLLPIFDTADKGGWEDSYPYRQVSCFALHPIYIDLLQIYDTLPTDIFGNIQNIKWNFEQGTGVDYPAVYHYKMTILRRIFNLVKDTLFKNAELNEFIEREVEWLKPYALYCMFRDQYKTSDFHQWAEHKTISLSQVQILSKQYHKELLFTYWVQFVADKQFKKSVQYANEHNVVIKGDLPIGVYLNSVECWAFPENFRLNMCAGAPPDAFSSDGQNWEFPTYDWDFMERDNYSWWRARLQRMATLFQALRVDHILGFFRIWEIPRDTCVRGLLGHFFPCEPISRTELEQRGLYDIERYVKPYVRHHLLVGKFGDDADYIANRFFIPRYANLNDDYYDFKVECDTEKKIENILTNEVFDIYRRKRFMKSLFELLGNVILIPDENQPGFYHVRTEVTVDHIEDGPDGPIVYNSSSWEELNDYQKGAVKDLYIDFTYNRQTHLWVEKARQKLHLLKNSTNMLICAEDLGQLTEGIIHTIKEYAFLSLNVQRMPKNINSTFENVEDFQYLSVCCPSTHDTSTLRGWWEENKARTAEFWRDFLLRHEEAPQHLEPYVAEMIIRQHLWSNSMWCIFLLQDLTSMFPNLTRQLPHEERINIPAENANHHWNYRYPYYLDELSNDYNFVNTIRTLVNDSHRI